ncbi:MAG: hypothetical protein V9G20_24465 [Candidatus Promineifilaceae bacterium]
MSNNGSSIQNQMRRLYGLTDFGTSLALVAQMGKLLLPVIGE